MKRWLFKLVLFLFLGATVNVAIAWACALWIDPLKGHHEHSKLMLKRSMSIVKSDESYSETQNNLQAESDAEANLLWWIDCYKRFGARRSVRGPYPMPSKFSKHIGILPNWADFDSWSRKIGHASNGFEIIDGLGWPFVCLRSRFKIIGERDHLTTIWSYKDAMSVIESGLILEDKKATTLKGGWKMAEARRSLPFDPVLGGFLSNTIFYAVVLAMIIYGPRTVRRVNRRRTGHCIKCGYDQRGDTTTGCPECGWGREVEG